MTFVSPHASVPDSRCASHHYFIITAATTISYIYIIQCTCTWRRSGRHRGRLPPDPGGGRRRHGGRRHGGVRGRCRARRVRQVHPNHSCVMTKPYALAPAAAKQHPFECGKQIALPQCCMHLLSEFSFALASSFPCSLAGSAEGERRFPPQLARMLVSPSCACILMQWVDCACMAMPDSSGFLQAVDVGNRRGAG